VKVGDLVYHVDDKEDGQIWPGIILDVWQERREYKVYFSGPDFPSREWLKPEELEILEK
jgi:hypothetical protein